MYETLNLFQTASALAVHAARQQATIARNIANADTPGYVAKTLPDFQDSYRSSAGLALRVTRPAHLQGTFAPAELQERPEGTEPSPNGNTVSLEAEMVRAVEVQQAHDQALAVYKHGLNILRLSIGR